MKNGWIARVLAGICILIASVIGAEAERLTVERIASLPSLTGTAPSSPVWSPDSSRVAFLWNDKAMPFRDVWVVSAAAGEPKRITDMSGRSGVSEIKGPKVDAFQTLLREAAARARGGVSGLVWTPDGEALIFNFNGHLFRVPADGGNVEQLTRTAAGRQALAFSPDGKYLSFLQQGDLWLWSQETNELVQATHVGVAAIGRVPGARYTRLDREFSSYKWSPDSGNIALYLDDRSRVRKVLIPSYIGDETHVRALRRDYPGDNDHVRTIGIYSVAGGRVQMVELEEKTDRRIGNYSWSPDGSQLLIDQSSESAIHRWIYIVNPTDASLRELWHDSRATRTTTLWNSGWQSDGQGIFFVSDMDGRHHLYSLPLEVGSPKKLTDGDWSVVGGRGRASLGVCAKTRQIYFESTQKSPYERQIYRMPEAGGPIVQVSTLPGLHMPFLAPDGSKMALLHSNDVTPTELYIADTRGGADERRITHSPPEEFYDHEWIQPKYVTFKSHVDGVTLHGRLLEPPNLDRSKKYPVILGPVYSNTVRNQWRGTYGTLQQYLALEGEYIGLHVDLRGSSGYGQDFRKKLRLDYGGIDIEDLHSGVMYVKTLPYVDPDRIGIWGSSYGGLMTAMSLFKKPGVYKAGVAGAPATNVWHATTGEVDVASRPDTHPEVYRKSSVYSYGENLQDHLMIIHGMQDSVVLFKDSVTLAEKLMLLGKDFDFVVAPSAVHGWTRKDYVAVYLLKKLVGHFDRYIGRGGIPRATDN
jgi:dipeptidyl-peptidase-4